MSSGPRVLRILTRPNLGGPTRQAIALWHAHRDLDVDTLLVTGRVDELEDPLSPADHGVPRLDFDAAVRAGPAAAGWVELPELGRGLRVLGDRRAARRLARLIAASRPDAVHTHTSKAGWLGRRAASRCGVPVIVHTFHGHVLRDYFGRVASAALRRLERRLAARTTHLLAVSGSCADELAELGVASRERFRVVPPAVPPVAAVGRADARRRLGIGADDRRVVAVGRFVPVKRLEDFVAAVAGDTGLSGDLFGAGPCAAALRAQAASAAPGRVRVRDADPEIGGLLSAYDALLLPSRREGCPLVAVEAFAAGVPVIGYDVPGVRDVLSGWGHGALVPEAAGPAGLLAALHEVEASAALRADYVGRSRSGLPRFSPAAVARELAGIYANHHSGAN